MSPHRDAEKIRQRTLRGVDNVAGKFARDSAGDVLNKLPVAWRLQHELNRKYLF